VREDTDLAAELASMANQRGGVVQAAIGSVLRRRAST
jgi:hypothetical protein